MRLQILNSLYDGVDANAADHYHAFYSSELQGIVTDPALMLVHIDDHMVHRGHAVFDTVIIVDGYAYQLYEHLARFQQSADLAGLRFPMSLEQLARTILETAAASKQVNGKQLLHLHMCCMPSVWLLAVGLSCCTRANLRDWQ